MKLIKEISIPKALTPSPQLYEFRKLDLRVGDFVVGIRRTKGFCGSVKCEVRTGMFGTIESVFYLSLDPKRTAGYVVYWGNEEGSITYTPWDLNNDLFFWKL